MITPKNGSGLVRLDGRTRGRYTFRTRLYGRAGRRGGSVRAYKRCTSPSPCTTCTRGFSIWHVSGRDSGSRRSVPLTRTRRRGRHDASHAQARPGSHVVRRMAANRHTTPCLSACHRRQPSHPSRRGDLMRKRTPTTGREQLPRLPPPSLIALLRAARRRLHRRISHITRGHQSRSAVVALGLPRSVVLTGAVLTGAVVGLRESSSFHA